MQTILLVEDDCCVRRLMADFLGENYEIIQASNGKEGLGMFKVNESDIELIITDCDMPIMNGVQMVEAIRSLSAKVKIMFFSASISEPQKFFGTGVHVDKFLEKPSSLDDIERNVKALLYN